VIRGTATILLAAAALVWCSQAVRKAERQTGNDLVGYMAASRALYAGGDPYHLPDRFPYIYPLFLAAVIRPLAALPLRAASVLWFAIQAACLWWVMRIVIRDSTLRPRDLLVLAAVVVAVFGDVLQNEFVNGQVNAIVLALAVAAVHLGGGRPRVAAPLLGAAIALKLTPALFLLYWAVERRYRLAAESVLWAIVLILSPAIVAGERVLPMYGTYVREFILARAVSAAPHPQAIFFTPYGFWGWLTGSPPGRALIVASSIGVVLALLLWHAGVRLRSGARRPAAWIYAAATPLLSPMSEVHHLTMLIPAAVMSAVSVQRRESQLVAIASAAFVLLVWIGRFDRSGPWYFLSVLVIILSAASVGGRAGGPGLTKKC
jgi:alpha-1,2-mannosyltransferase